jgi:hypothetical protein
MSQVQASLLRGMFIDISKGFSVGKFDGKEIKIKHLNLEDQAKIDTFRQEYYDYAVKRGIPKEEDRLRVLDKQGFWTKTDEDKIFYSKDFITRLNATLNKIAVPSQRKALEDQIRDEQKKLNDLQEEKYGFVGKTAEIYANKRLNEYFIFYSMRKGDLNEMLFDEGDFDELEEYQLNELTHCFNTSVGNIDGLAIKKIALQPFFQNLFYLTDSIQEFWGKRILDLTIFQSDLSYWGKTFKNMINNSENRIPAEILSDPEKLISFMNLNNEAQKNLTNTQGELGAVSQVGATNEDYEKMGMKVDNSQAVWARKKLKETGKGSLTGREMAELRQTGGIKKWDAA